MSTTINWNSQDLDNINKDLSMFSEEEKEPMYKNTICSMFLSGVINERDFDFYSSSIEAFKNKFEC